MADKTISALTAATTPLAGTEVLPIVQSSSTKKVAVNDLTVKNVRSNATTGLLQVAGPTTGTTRVMTTPDANFTVARTDASQTFAGAQNFSDFYLTGSTKKYYWYVDGSDNLRVVRYTSGGIYEAIPFEISVNSDVKLYSGNLVIGTSGKGIDFSATAGAGTSELLNDYEEGIWSPTIIGTTTAGTATYDARNASYTKIGRLVHVEVYMVYSAGTGSGNLRIGNLPYTVENTVITYTPILCRQSSITVPVGEQIYGRAEPGTSYIRMYSITDAGAQTDLAYDDNALIAFQATYTAA